MQRVHKRDTCSPEGAHGEDFVGRKPQAPVLNSCHPHLGLPVGKNTFQCRPPAADKSFHWSKPLSPHWRKGRTPGHASEGSSEDQLSKLMGSACWSVCWVLSLEQAPLFASSSRGYRSCRRTAASGTCVDWISLAMGGKGLIPPLRQPCFTAATLCKEPYFTTVTPDDTHRRGRNRCPGWKISPCCVAVELDEAPFKNNGVRRYRCRFSHGNLRRKPHGLSGLRALKHPRVPALVLAKQGLSSGWYSKT